MHVLREAVLELLSECHAVFICSFVHYILPVFKVFYSQNLWQAACSFYVSRFSSPSFYFSATVSGGEAYGSRLKSASPQISMHCIFSQLQLFTPQHENILIWLQLIPISVGGKLIQTNLVLYLDRFRCLCFWCRRIQH